MDPWVCFPFTATFTHSRCFSATSTMVPPGTPQSGTSMKSSSEKYPASIRWPMPIRLLVSSSATKASPMDIFDSESDSKNLAP